MVRGVADQQAVELASRRRTEPEIETDVVGRRFLGSRADAVPTHVPTPDGLHSRDRLEPPRTHPINDTAVVGLLMDLRTDLAHHAVFANRLAHGNRLGRIERHGLLQIDVLAGRRRPDRLKAVPVRRRSDDDSIDPRERTRAGQPGLPHGPRVQALQRMQIAAPLSESNLRPGPVDAAVVRVVDAPVLRQLLAIQAVERMQVSAARFGVDAMAFGDFFKVSLRQLYAPCVVAQHGLTVLAQHHLTTRIELRQRGGRIALCRRFRGKPTEQGEHSGQHRLAK